MVPTIPYRTEHRKTRRHVRGPHPLPPGAHLWGHIPGLPRRTMLQGLAAAGLGGVAAFSTADSATAASPSTDWSAFDRQAQSAFERMRLVGSAVAVVSSERIVHTLTMGSRTLQPRRQVTSQKRFRVGSTTKSMTSAFGAWTAKLVRHRLLPTQRDANAREPRQSSCTGGPGFLNRPHFLECAQTIPAWEQIFTPAARICRGRRRSARACRRAMNRYRSRGRQRGPSARRSSRTRQPGPAH